MFTVAGRTMLVTGGAMGMGRLYCEHGVAEGATVIIWDVNQAAMQETAGELTARGGTVHTYRVDVSDRRAIEKAAKKTLDAHGPVDILFNNAGVVSGNSYFWENSAEDIERTMRINAEALMHICRALLPAMLEQRCGRIVNMCSGAGLFPMPRLASYCASKHAAVGWSDSLRMELEDAGYFNVCVTTVTPGHINTGMFTGFRSPLLTPSLEPEVLARRVWDAMKKGAVVVRSPWSLYLGMAFKALLPVRLSDLIMRLMGAHEVMVDFQPRPEPQLPQKKPAARRKKKVTAEVDTQ